MRKRFKYLITLAMSYYPPHLVFCSCDCDGNGQFLMLAPAQVLPFVESYFVLCAARADQMPQPEDLKRVPSSELARTASLGLSGGVSSSTSADMPATLMSGAAAEQATATSTAPPDQMSDQRKAWLEAHLPFLR